MTLNRSLIPVLGLLLWAGLILLFNRQDLAFYLATFMLSLSITLLTLYESRPKFAEAKLNIDENIND